MYNHKKHCEDPTPDIKIDDFHTDKIVLNKGIRQCENISPKLFTLSLENVFQLNCQKTGLNIDEVYLNFFRFGEEIALITGDIQVLDTMLNELNVQSILRKTKIISCSHHKIIVDNIILEKVEH